MFAQVDGAGIDIASALDGHHLLGVVEEGHDDVDTRLQRGVILTETLDNFGLALRNDHNGLHGEEDDQKNDGSKNIGCY